MLKTLNRFFEQAFAGNANVPTADREHALRVATALLLIEVARADYKDDLTEDAVIFALIKDFFALTADETTMLIDEARQQADHSVSLQQFTRRLTEQLSGEEKRQVVEMLWKVALADSHLDKHEDHLVRKVAELLYVPHSELIQIRNRVRGPAV
jgi:uncharacterized tellurite resistance protein B-like protein